MTTEAAMPIELPEPTDITDEALDTSDDSGIEWGSIAGEQGAGEDDVEATEGDVEVLAKAPAPTVTETPPAAPPAPVEPVTPPPTQTPQSPAQVVPPPVAGLATGTAPESAPSQIPTVPVSPTLDIGAWEQEQIGKLAEFYAINEEDAASLQTEPELVLPKLAANMHMAATKSILASVAAMMPEMLAQHTQQMTVEQQARTDFFTANPDLVGQEQAILQVGKMFRAANPTATKEQAVKMIGDMVRMSLGLPLQQAQSQAPATPAAPSAPAQAQIMPFTPSKSGGSAGSSINQPNMWEALISDD